MSNWINLRVKLSINKNKTKDVMQLFNLPSDGNEITTTCLPQYLSRLNNITQCRAAVVKSSFVGDLGNYHKD